MQAPPFLQTAEAAKQMDFANSRTALTRTDQAANTSQTTYMQAPPFLQTDDAAKQVDLATSHTAF